MKSRVESRSPVFSVMLPARSFIAFSQPAGQIGKFFRLSLFVMPVSVSNDPFSFDESQTNRFFVAHEAHIEDVLIVEVKLGGKIFP